MTHLSSLGKFRARAATALIGIALVATALPVAAPAVASASVRNSSRSITGDSVPRPMSDPMGGICGTIRFGAAHAATPRARKAARGMLATCGADLANSQSFWEMTRAGYAGSGGAHWGSRDHLAMTAMSSTTKRMTTSIKSDLKSLTLVMRSSSRAAANQIARAAQAAQQGRRFREVPLQNPATGFCQALDAATLASTSHFRPGRYKSLQLQQATCRHAKNDFRRAWRMVHKMAKKQHAKGRDSGASAVDARAATRSFWSDIGDAFSSFGQSFLNALDDVLTLGGLLETGGGGLVEPAYSAFVNARNRVLAGMEFFADSAAQEANARSPLQVSSMGAGTIQIMKPGTSSYTNEPDPSHPKIPLNYLVATGGTPPYKFSNTDPDSSVKVSQDGIISGWLTGFGFKGLEKSPGFKYGLNIRVTDANQITKVVKVSQDYIFAPEWNYRYVVYRGQWVGSPVDHKYDGCPYDCVASTAGPINPLPLLPPFVDGPDSQWADSAQATSSFHTGKGSTFSPSQATGAPTGTSCVDYSKAWTSKKRSTLDTLTVKYDRAVVPSSVRIYEQYHPGAITSVTVSGPGHSAVVYTAAAQRKQGQCPTSLTIPITNGGAYPVDFPVDTVAVNLDQRVRDQRDQIDAVQLVGTAG